MTASRFRIEGRVQGVGFRAWTLRRALARGLSGWVRNERDGSVSVLAAGPAEQVAAFAAELALGPAAARVEGVSEERAEPPPTATGFRVV